MEAVVVTFISGMDIPAEHDGKPSGFLILEGEVAVYRKKLQQMGFLTILEPGDVLFPENIFDVSLEERTAIAQTDVQALPLNNDSLKEYLEEVPDWLSDWVIGRLKKELGIRKRLISALSGTYTLCSLTYQMLYTFSSGESSEDFKCLMRPLVEEIAKTLPPPRIQVESFLYALSDVGLADIRGGDPLSQSIEVSDKDLFVGFLVYLQRKAGLPVGLYGNNKVDIGISLSREAGLLLDGLFNDPELGPRMFEPDRSLVHLPEEKICEIFQMQGCEDDLDLNHSSIGELEKLGVFTIAHDDQVVSVFVNLRNVLRINIRCDVEGNFSDISEYLCELITKLRIQAERAI